MEIQRNMEIVWLCWGDVSRFKPWQSPRLDNLVGSGRWLQILCRVDIKENEESRGIISSMFGGCGCFGWQVLQSSSSYRQLACTHFTSEWSVYINRNRRCSQFISFQSWQRIWSYHKHSAKKNTWLKVGRQVPKDLPQVHARAPPRPTQIASNFIHNCVVTQLAKQSWSAD